MATRKRTAPPDDARILPDNGDIVINPLGDADQVERLIRVPASDPDEDLRTLLKRYGKESGLKIRVYRMVGGSQPQYLFSSADPVDEEFIQGEYGGGTYKLTFFIDDDYRDFSIIRIADRADQEQRRNPPGTPAAPTPPAPGSGGGDVDFLKELMLEIVRGGTQQQRTGPEDLIAMLVQLDSLRGKPSDPMETFIRGIEFAKEHAGDAGGDDWKKDLVKTAKDVIPALAGPWRQPAAPGPAAAAAPNNAPPEAQMFDKLKLGLAYLKREAMAGQDPALVSDWVISHAHDPAYQPFIRLAIDTPFEALGEYDPEIIRPPYEKWFRDVHSGIRSAFSGEDPVGNDSGRPSGNTEDAGAHGPGGTNGKHASDDNPPGA